MKKYVLVGCGSRGVYAYAKPIVAKYSDVATLVGVYTRTILARLNGTHHEGGAQAYLPTGTVTLRPYHFAEGLQHTS